MKTFELKPTSHADLFRVVDRDGNWTHYFHKPTAKYLRAVSHILDSGYAKGARFMEYLKNGSKEDLERKLKSAGERGDRIHQFIAKILSGEKMHRASKVLAEDNKTEVALSNDEWDAVLSFANFWKLHEPRLLIHESSVFNLTAEYAGTLDAVIRLTKACGIKSCGCEPFIGKLGLYDWKSSGAIYPSYGAQVAAYAKAETIAGLKVTPQFDYTAILRIGTSHKRTGGYEFEAYDGGEMLSHFGEFRAAKTIADAEYKAFDPANEIYDIPDTLDMKVVREEIPPHISKKPRTPRKGIKAETKVTKTHARNKVPKSVAQAA